jgi:hypothetical protein
LRVAAIGIRRGRFAGDAGCSHVGKKAKVAKVANTHPRGIALCVCKALKALKVLNTHPPRVYTIWPAREIGLIRIPGESGRCWRPGFSRRKRDAG